MWIRRYASIGREILDGKIAANPYEKGNEEACTYCAYKKVCGFDGSIPGYEKRQLEDLDKQALMQRMQKTEWKRRIKETGTEVAYGNEIHPGTAKSDRTA